MPPTTTRTVTPEAARRSWRLYAGSVTRKIAVVAGGAALAQIVSVLAAPVVARIYGPLEYGALAVFTSIVLIASSAATLAYHLAIPLPFAEATALRLLTIATWSSACTAIISGLGLGLMGEFVPELFNVQRVLHLLFLIPISVFLTSFAQVLDQWLVRKKNYGAISAAGVTQAVVAGAARIGVGLVSATAAALVAVGVLAQVVQVLMLLRVSRHMGARFQTLSATPRGSWSTLRAVARRYNDFPKFRAPQQLLNISSRSAPLLLLAATFSPAVGALYSIALTVLYLPVSLVSISAGKVFVQRFAEQVRDGNRVAPAVTKATFGLAVIGILPFGLLAVAGPRLFRVVFGDQWSGAGEYAQWLSVMVFAHFINVPAVSSMTVLRAQRKLLEWEVASSVGKVVIVLVAARLTADPVSTVAAYSVFGTLAYLLLIRTGIAGVKVHDATSTRGSHGR